MIGRSTYSRAVPSSFPSPPPLSPMVYPPVQQCAPGSVVRSRECGRVWCRCPIGVVRACCAKIFLLAYAATREAPLRIPARARDFKKIFPETTLRRTRRQGRESGRRTRAIAAMAVRHPDSVRHISLSLPEYTLARPLAGLKRCPPAAAAQCQCHSAASTRLAPPNANPWNRAHPRTPAPHP